jgi:hypothetical protein
LATISAAASAIEVIKRPQRMIVLLMMNLAMSPDLLRNEVPQLALRHLFVEHRA